MWDDLRKKLLQKELTRREFLQFLGGSAAILFGLGNIITLIKHTTKSADSPKVADDNNKFGTRKFGV